MQVQSGSMEISHSRRLLGDHMQTGSPDRFDRNAAEGGKLIPLASDPRGGHMKTSGVAVPCHQMQAARLVTAVLDTTGIGKMPFDGLQPEKTREISTSALTTIVRGGGVGQFLK